MCVWEYMGHCKSVAALTDSGQGGVVSKLCKHSLFYYTCSTNWLILLNGR